MTMIRKATSSEVGPDLEFVLSDATVDRMGDVIDPAGWQLAAFRKNPIALFGHDNGFPIGKWANVRVEGGKLKGRLEFADEGTSDRIDELRRLVQQGILRAVSVGFKPIDAEPMDKADPSPWGPKRYKKQELLETSLVSVPANPAALAVAKSLSISEDTLNLAFGEHADGGLGIVRRGTTGEQAANPPKTPKHMRSAMTKTLSERVEDAQSNFIVARDAYNDHVAEDDFDIEVADGLEAEMKDAEARLAALQKAEKSLAARTEVRPTSPAVSLKGRQKDVSGLDLLVRATVVRGIAHFGPGRKSIDQVLEERYPGHEATAIVTKTDQVVGTTGASGFAAELVQESYAGFMSALTGRSIYPILRDRGVAYSFDGNGTVNIPSRTAGGAGGGFFVEGDPIRVGRVTTASVPMTARQMGVIVTFTRKLAMQSTPSIESVVRQGMLEDTAAVLDPLLLDATASSTARPAGLLNGVAAAATGYGGGDYLAVLEDFRALLAPFYAANAADGITVVMNPAQGLSLALMPGPDGVIGSFMAPLRERLSFVESTHATAGRLIAIRTSDFATALGDAPQFDISEQATLHMEDTTPLPIVDGSAAVADPVRSLWQTGSIGVRMIMDISWMMRRSGVVSWINGTSW